MANKSESTLEDSVADFIRKAGYPEPERQYRALSPLGRKHRFDFAWPMAGGGGLLIEVQGGIWVRGRHVRPAGYIKDCEKITLAGLIGYTTLLVTQEHINDEHLGEWLRMYFGH